MWAVVSTGAGFMPSFTVCTPPALRKTIWKGQDDRGSDKGKGITIMARITHVKKAQKDQGTCMVCHKTIRAGEPYKFFKNRIGMMSQRKVFCGACPIRASHMTTSDKLATLYGIQEGLEDQAGNFTTLDDIKEALETAANEARDVAQEYEDSLSNMPEGLQQGDTGQQIQEKVDAINEWADELESAANDVEAMEAPDEIEPDAECAFCNQPYSAHAHDGDGDPAPAPSPSPTPSTDPHGDVGTASDVVDAPCDDFQHPDTIEEATNRLTDASGSLSV
jgi:hypothetical protein